MSFKLLMLVIFVLGISINVFYPERVIAVIAAIAGIIWAIIQFARLA